MPMPTPTLVGMSATVAPPILLVVVTTTLLALAFTAVTAHGFEHIEIPARSDENGVLELCFPQPEGIRHPAEEPPSHWTRPPSEISKLICSCPPCRVHGGAQYVNFDIADDVPPVSSSSGDDSNPTTAPAQQPVEIVGFLFTGSIHGAVRVSRGTVIFRNCDFFDNSLRKGDGAGLYVASGAKAVVINCRFERNVAMDGNGGAMCNEGTLHITDAHTSRNQASYGGAIYNGLGGHLVSEGGVHRDNLARYKGGHVYDAATARALPPDGEDHEDYYASTKGA